MRVAFVAFAAALLAAAPASAILKVNEPWTPSMDDVRHIESIVRMPTGASPIAAYVRFYTGVVDNGRKVIEGVYLARSVMQDMHRDIHTDVNVVIANDMPFINDGGCLMVTVYYDVDSEKITGVRCNGFA